MTKEQEERNTNRILLTMAIAFVALIGMYYLYALIYQSPHKSLILYGIGGIFLIAAVVMTVLSSKKSKESGFSFAEGCKKLPKAKTRLNFAIFFLVCTVLSVVCALVPNLKTTMIVIAWAIVAYTVILIVATTIWQSMEAKKEKKKRISKKAAEKAARKKMRNS